MIIINLNNYIKNKSKRDNFKLNIINNFANNINSEFFNNIINNKKIKCLLFLDNKKIISIIFYNKLFNYKDKCKFILQLFAINPKFRKKGYSYKVFDIFKNFITIKEKKRNHFIFY